MTDTRDERPGRLYTATVVLSSLVFALPMLFGRIIEAAIDSANPADIDVSQDLAYLRELLGFSLGFLGLLLLIIAALIVHLYRREHRFSTVSLPVTILAVQLVAGVAVVLMGAANDSIERG